MTTKTSVPRGRPKSGRIWREPGEKSKNAIAVPSLKTPWRKRQIERAEKKAMKERERELKEMAKKQREESRKRVEAKQQRKLENQKKSEVVQKITNSTKLKRLRKKQLKCIEKR